MTIIKTFAAIALAAYLYWVVISALIRGRTPDFGRDIDRREQPGKYWTQVVLCTWLALGLTIYVLFLIGDLERQ